MDIEVLTRIFRAHQSKGCFMPRDEWEENVRSAYAELLRIAQTEPYSRITVTYSELGRRIGLFPVSAWFHLKIAWILYACATYAEAQGLPLITALVVNSETGQPGMGFWALEGVPAHLRKEARIEDTAPLQISGERDAFWVGELRRIDMWGKGGSPRQDACSSSVPPNPH